MKGMAYTRTGLRGAEAAWQRLLEMVPGAISWTTLLGMVLLSLIKPVTAAVAVVAFYLYWLFKLFYLTGFMVASYTRLAWELQTDWMGRVRWLDTHRQDAEIPQPEPKGPFGNRACARIFQREVRSLKRSGSPPPMLSEIRHVVLLPIAGEAREIYEPGIVRLVSQQFPSKQILLVLAVEERVRSQVLAEAKQVAGQYRERFLDVLVTVHPDGRIGEARVKGANVTWAAKRAAAAFAERGWPIEHAIVSCFDSDSMVDNAYFACLTYAFMVCPNRLRASYQPIPVFHNNFWEVPGFARVLDAGASFFQLIEATNPEKLVTFSSHSMSFQALTEVGYWPIDMISDDSAIFWKGLLHYDGNYRAVPLYVTVSMDIAASASFWRTARNIYRQKRRWAWGVENFPILMRAFLHNRNIRLWDKIRHGFKMVESHVSWATWPFLLMGIGWLPGLFAGQDFATSVMYYTAPRISGTIFNLALLALLATVIISLLMVPRPPAPHPLLRRFLHIGEWLWIPVVAVVFSALPALDAQTRLMLGLHMEFWVTEKTRKGS